MKLLAIFEGDTASKNIGESLISMADWKDHKMGLIHDDMIIRRYPGEHLYTPDIGNENQWLSENIKGVIVLSRHRSKSEDPTLTVHPTGNYNTADFGGEPGKLSTSYPRMAGGLLRALKVNAKDLNFKVSLEVTHHGPLSSKPTLFIEIGSSEEQWDKKPPADAIARSILEPDIQEIPIAIGIGGGHYAPRFTDACLKGLADLGHMLPAYHAEIIRPDTIQKMVDATPDATHAIIHPKKGIDKDIIEGWANDAGLIIFDMNNTKRI